MRSVINTYPVIPDNDHYYNHNAINRYVFQSKIFTSILSEILLRCLTKPYMGISIIQEQCTQSLSGILLSFLLAFEKSSQTVKKIDVSNILLVSR